MNDLAAFLRARVDEDERTAHAALGLLGTETDWHSVEQLQQRGLTRADAMHVARHSSRRVLREVEAKRRIVDEIARGVEYEAEGLAEGVLAWLALPYADHPDYRQEWRA